MGKERKSQRTGSGYHVNDLGEGDLQCDVDDVVCVLHWPQCVGVVGEQVSHQLLGVATVSSEVHCTEGKRGSINASRNSLNTRLQKAAADTVHLSVCPKYSFVVASVKHLLALLQRDFNL